MKKKNLIFKPGFFLLLAVMVFFLDYDAFFAAVISVAVHEIGHLTAMEFFHIKMKNIAFSCSGMNIGYDGKYTPYLQEIAVAFSGPAANMFLSLLALIIFKKAEDESFIILLAISTAVGIFNLLPVKYLDGGKILHCILSLFFGPRFADAFLIIISKIFIVLILFSGLYLFYMSGYNFTLLLSAVWLLYVVNR